MAYERWLPIADDLCNCHAEGRRFESDQPLFTCKSALSITTVNFRMGRFSITL